MTRLRTRSLLASLALATALLGACGSDDGDSTSLGNEAPPTSAADDNGDDGSETTAVDKTSGGATPPAATVELEGTSFDPATVEVKVGDTVLWKWADNALHNVTGGPLDSKNKSSGEYRYTFTEAGEVDYRCTIHPGMDGTVKVS